MKSYFRYLLLAVAITSSSFAINANEIERESYNLELLKNRPKLTLESLRQFYYVDEWANADTYDLKRYILISASAPRVSIYDNKELKGEPKFFVESLMIYINAKSPNVAKPQLCLNSTLLETKPLRKWLNCSDTPCQVTSSQKEKKVEVWNPYENFWFIPLPTGSNLRCPYNFPFYIYVTNKGVKDLAKYFLFVKPVEVNSKYAAISIDDKLHYIDLKDLRKDGKDPTLIDRWNSPLKYSDFDERWLKMKNGRPEQEIEILFKQLSQCLTLKDDKCLHKKSYNTKEANMERERSEVLRGNFSPLSWSEDDKAELNACIESKLMFSYVSLVYLGKNKKCYFGYSNGEAKIISIDYPEAFFIRSPNISNFEIK